MGKNPWEESDVDLLALQTGARQETRWGRVFVAILIIAMITFVAAYYVPMFRAHKALVTEFKELMAKYRAMDEKLAETRRLLDKESKEKHRLKAHQEERQAANKAAQAKLETQKATLGKQLSKEAGKGDAQVELSPDAVRVTLANDLVFKSHTLTIPQGGSKRLCEIAQNTSGPLRLTALAKADEPKSVLLAARYPTVRALTAARAATAAADLEQRCPVATAQLQSAAIVFDKAPEGHDVGLPALRIELLSSAAP
jgi:chemotaxis protein MotB